MEFKIFLLESEDKDVKETLQKIPKKHAELIKNYKINFENGNTLKKSNQHVGEIDEKNKKITVVGGWNYSKEVVYLHELAHSVWKYIMTQDDKKQWSNLIKKNKIKNPQDNEEELFCMTYAAAYAKHPPKTYCNDILIKFIKNI
jgi:hypothetical protein